MRRFLIVRARLVLVAAGLAALWACAAHPLSSPDPDPQQQLVTYFEPGTKELDLLVMVDNSNSMKEKQENLARNFPVLINELRKVASGMPNLHLAIVSSDLGAGVTTVATCKPGGDGGAFKYLPTGNCQGLSDPNARFIVSQENETRNNYPGDIAQVFGCLARLGKDGCGLEEQLESVRQALTPGAIPANAGFLRDGAFLAVLLITDEDDCSIPPTSTMFAAANIPDGVGINYLCYPPAATCGGKPLPFAPFSQPVTQCTSRPDGGGSLTPVQDYVTFLKSLKPDPKRIIVSAITGVPQEGEPGTYQAVLEHDELNIAFTACGANGGATSALRIKELVESFGANGSINSICADNFGPAMQTIGETLRRNLEGLCLESPLLDGDPKTPGVQPQCFVSETTPSAPPRLVPPCSSGESPCWQMLPPDNPSNTCQNAFQLNVTRKTPVPPGTQATVKCATCPKPHDPRCGGR